MVVIQNSSVNYFTKGKPQVTQGSQQVNTIKGPTRNRIFLDLMYFSLFTSIEHRALLCSKKFHVRKSKYSAFLV